MTKGSPIFNLLLFALPIINNQLNWIPDNGKLKKNWNDIILEQGLLSQHADLTPLQIWMQDNGITRLYDISFWDSSTGYWSRWNLESLPLHLEPFGPILLNALHGRAPRCLADKDSRDWRDSHYTICKGLSFSGKIIYPFLVLICGEWFGSWMGCPR